MSGDKSAAFRFDGVSELLDELRQMDDPQLTAVCGAVLVDGAWLRDHEQMAEHQRHQRRAVFVRRRIERQKFRVLAADTCRYLPDSAALGDEELMVVPARDDVTRVFESFDSDDVELVEREAVVHFQFRRVLLGDVHFVVDLRQAAHFACDCNRLHQSRQWFSGSWVKWVDKCKWVTWVTDQYRKTLDP